MRYESGNHTIQLEHCSNLDKEGWEARRRGIIRSGSCPYSGYFYKICPAYKERRVVLPMKIAFEQVSTWAICWSINEGQMAERAVVVKSDALQSGIQPHKKVDRS